MKNFEIWESDFNQNPDRGGMLIPSNEISQFAVLPIYLLLILIN